ncbi:MAG: PilW family protein [Janthinobacterium lividum]
MALWIVAVVVLELARIEIQQLRLRQALDLRLRAAVMLDTFAETRHAAGAGGDGGNDGDGDGSGGSDGSGGANGRAAIDWAARTADALPDGRMAVRAAAGGAIRVEVSWRRAAGRSMPAHVRPEPGAAPDAAAGCRGAGAQRDCLAIVLSDRPAMQPRSAARDASTPHLRSSPPGSPPPGSPLSRGSTRAAGHSLLELLIAAVLGGMVVTAALSAYQARRDSQAQRVDDARMRMDAQAAIDLLRTYARLAGYGLSFTPGTSSSLPAIRPCLAGARPGLSCLRSIPGSDGVVIHYRADAVSASKGAQTRQLLDCGGRLLSARGAVTAARVAVREEDASGLPRLHCRGLGQNGGDPLVEGVERLRIRYWLPGRPEPVAAHALGDDAPAISGLEFCVTVRGHSRLPRRGLAFAGAYRDCDGRWQPAAQDGYARRTSAVTVALRHSGASAAAGADRHATNRGAGNRR